MTTNASQNSPEEIAALSQLERAVREGFDSGISNRTLEAIWAEAETRLDKERLKR